jgi:hypothetical protein
VRTCLALVAVAAAVTFAPGTAAGQEVLDQGVFLIARDSAEVGREEFAIRATPGRQGRPGVLAVATDRYREREARSALELTNEHIPLSYQVDVTLAGGSTERLSGQLGRGRFAIRLVHQAGEVVREFPVPADVVVLDDDGFVQFYFLPRPVADSTRPVSVLRPREARLIAGEVRAMGVDTLTVGTRRVPADHYALALPGGDAREFWFTPSGSLLKVAIPARSIVAVRSSLPAR